MPNRIRPYDDGYYPTATPTGPVFLSYPLPQQPTAILYSQPHVQTYASYVAPAFSSTMPGVSGAYFVGDTNVQRSGEFLVTFERQWATVPGFFNDFESYAYIYPAYAPSAVPGTPASITAINRSGSNDVISTTVSGVAVNDVVYINASFVNGTLPYTQGGLAKVTAVNPGVSVTVASFFVGSSSTFSSVSGTIMEYAPGRQLPQSFIVASRMLSEFFYTANPQADIALSQPFQPVLTTTGYPTDTLTANTAPTAAVYAGLVSSEGELVVESYISRYMGDIWQRITRLVPAR